MATFHISEAEAAKDFAGLMDRVRAGSEVIIEDGIHPPVIVKSNLPMRGRLLSESLALAEAHAKELGYEPEMDEEFAADIRERIANRKPRDTSAWN